MTGREAEKSRESSRFWSRALTAALVVGAVLIVGRMLAPQTIGEQIRRHVVAKFKDHYGPNVRVSIRRGHFEPSVGVILEGIRLSLPSESGAESNLSIDRLVALSDTKPERLLQQQSPLETKRLVIEEIQIAAQVDSSGRIPLLQLWPPPALGSSVVPRIEVRGGSVKLTSDSDPSRPVALNLNQILILDHGSEGKQIGISASSDFAKKFVVNASINPQQIAVRGDVHQASISSQLLRRLPASIKSKVDPRLELAGRCDLSFAANKSADVPWDFAVQTKLNDVQLSHPELPAPITHVAGVATIRPDGIEVQTASGRFHHAAWSASGRIKGFGWPASAEFDVSARGLLLETGLSTCLPEKMRNNWDKFQPHGHVDFDARLTHDGDKWKLPAATVQCNGVDIRFDKFPYPVKELVGRIEVADGIALCKRIDGMVSGQKLRCGFQVPIVPNMPPERLVVLSMDQPVSIDETLLSSLTPRLQPMGKLETFVRSLNARGQVHLVKGTFWTDENGERSHVIDLNVSQGQLRYDKFAYPLHNVQGRIRVENELVKIDGFRGANTNGGAIDCQGKFRGGSVQHQRPSELQLTFLASQVPLDQSLRSSLPKAAQYTWDSLVPIGILDALQVDVTQSGNSELDIQLVAQEFDAKHYDLSIRPRELPYRLDIAQALVRYDGSGATIHSLKAVHDATQLSVDGMCAPAASGQWRLALNVHGGSRISPDAQLIQALPATLQSSMRRLQLRKPVSVRGQTAMLIPDSKVSTPRFDWDVVLQLEGNRIGDVGPVHSLRGEISSKGYSDAERIVADGTVRLDSAHVYDIQVTSIRGPYRVRDNLLRLGQPVVQTVSAPESGSRSQKLRGKIFGGNIELAGDVLLSTANFDVDVSLDRGTVPSLLAELGKGDYSVTGVFKAGLELEGILGTTDLLKGNGTAQVTGANLYQLPQIIKLLNLLRITPTEDVAFTDADVKFGINEDQINFDDLKLWGDLVSLHGEGTMDRRQELQLRFNTRVSPKNYFTKLMPLRNQKYTLWDVDVYGPLDSPEFELRPLEGVGKTLEMILPVKVQRASHLRNLRMGTK